MRTQMFEKRLFLPLFAAAALLANAQDYRASGLEFTGSDLAPEGGTAAVSNAQLQEEIDHEFCTLECLPDLDFSLRGGLMGAVSGFTGGRTKSTYDIIIKNCSYSEAVSDCTARGGHLVCFETEDELNEVISLIENSYGRSNRFYIGARRYPNSNAPFSYKWINGSSDVINAYGTWYDNKWLAGEPSFYDPSIRADEMVAEMFYYAQTGKWVWNDVPDNLPDYVPGSTIGYICEYEGYGNYGNNGNTGNNSGTSTSYGTQVFGSKSELKSYVVSQVDNLNFDLTFRYTGEISDLGQYLVDLTGMSASQGTYTTQSDGSKLMKYTLIPYPGMRIYAAYRKGQTGSLSMEEQVLLANAQKAVEELKKGSGGENSYRLEMAIHDWLQGQTTYYNDYSVKNPDPYHPVRFRSAFGALEDGKSNCSGYADAFYLLASLAGFKVSLQRCYIPGTSEWHIFNTVCFNGKYYGVDVGFDDEVNILDSGGKFGDYSVFNAGKDVLCPVFTWDSLYEAHPIVSQSDSNYFYYSGGTAFKDDYAKAYYDLDSLAAAIASLWGVRGYHAMNFMWVGQAYEPRELSSKIEYYCNQYGRYYSFTWWANVRTPNTYFAVIFS